jgi:hypothetical protein
MITLGAEVKDKVSGFVGIAVAKHNYINGCTRITVQPKVDKQGKLPDSQTFDELQLSVISKKIIKLVVSNKVWAQSHTASSLDLRCPE